MNNQERDEWKKIKEGMRGVNKILRDFTSYLG
jgi:hypothetical protein